MITLTDNEVRMIEGNLNRISLCAQSIRKIDRYTETQTTKDFTHEILERIEYIRAYIKK